jgi:hypothetical protein
MEIDMLKTVKVNAKTLKLHMKVRDTFEANLYDAEGAMLKSYEGYVPDFMPGQHYGDYLILDIDLDTGAITNWVIPSSAEIQRFINPPHQE